MHALKVVIDTNIIVAAGFNSSSHSARLLEMLRRGNLILVWDQATRRESQRIIHQIPHLDWEDIAGLFTPESEFTGRTKPGDYPIIADPDDRKFAALAAASGAILVTNDEHLLSVRSELDLQILTPAELQNFYNKIIKYE